MKKLIYSLFLSVLVFVQPHGRLTTTESVPSDNSSIAVLLNAHNAIANSEALSSSTSQAKKIVSYSPDQYNTQKLFQWNETVSNRGSSYLRSKTDPQGSMEQIDIYADGQGYRVATKLGQTSEVTELTGAQLDSIMFEIQTFGLPQILYYLSTQSQSVIYQGQTAEKEDKFKISTGDNVWFLYADKSHLISRIETEEFTMKYADYKSVDGIELPFYQQVWRGKVLDYDLIFTKIELHKTFPPAYFTRQMTPK